MPFARPPAPALALATWLLCLTSTPLQARTPATSADTGDSVAHTVQRGDTLEGLARQYLNTPQQWPLLQRRNAVREPRRLRPGSVLHIPAHLLPGVPAHLEFVQGDVRRSPGPDSADAPALQPGSALPEGTRLQVGAHSFITVRLADGSVVHVPAQSQVQLRQMRRIGRTGQVRTLIELHRGGLDAEVPASRDASRHFEIRTPRAATSVRGTRFGVLLTSDGRSSTSVLEGAVAVQALAGPAPRPDGAAPAPSAAMPPAPPPSPLSGTHLTAGQGVAVGADGTLGTVRRLLPAPDLSALPQTLGEAGMVALALGPQGAIDQAMQEADAAARPVRYQVQMARDGALQQVLRNGIFAADAIRLPGLEDGSYVLAVRALDGAGLAGPFARRPLTVKTQPVAPLYQSPLPGATVARSGAALRCTGVPGITRFHVQVAARADFAELLQDAPAQPECALELRTLAAGSYYWRAASVRLRADASADTGPFAAPQPFTVAERPTPLSPQALQSAQHAQQLYWPSQPGQSFRLQCARDATFATLACDETLHQPHWNITGLAPGRYWVRLQTHDPSGLVSDFSAPRHLHVGASGLHTSDGLGVSSADGQPVAPP